MTKKKNHQKTVLRHFDKVWFPDETEYFIFLVWATFACVLLLQLI